LREEHVIGIPHSQLILESIKLSVCEGRLLCEAPRRQTADLSIVVRLPSVEERPEEIINRLRR
jgi:hypothetical protein